jgi:amino acid adenylation domain-containing protein
LRPASSAASPVEAHFYVASQVHPAPGLNTVTHAVHIRGPLAPDRLGAALREICTRHDALRSRLEAADGVVVRIVSEEARGAFLEVRPCPATDAALAEELDAVRHSLSPESLPWKAVLLKHGADDHTFVFAAHRTIWDERSTTLLGPELSALYAQRGALAEANASREETGEAEQDVTASQAAEGAHAFATTLLDAPPGHGFPTKGPRPKSQDVTAAGFDLSFDESTRALLTQTAHAWGLAPFVVQAAAVLHVLAYHCGQDKIAVGLPFDLSRGPAERRRLGSLTAILPLGFDASAPTFEALTWAFAERIRNSAVHAATPFEAVAKELGARSDPSANPLFQIACIEDADLALTLEGCETHLRPVAPPPQQLDIFVRLAPGELRVAYASRLIADSAIASFARSLSVFLPAALRAPRSNLLELPLLADTDREALVGDARRTAEPSFLAEDLYHLVTRHCAPESTRPALTCGGKQLSYGELLPAVEALAGTLAASGRQPGELAGICLPRSVDMVVAMLAVLRGGSAYVPLDPAFPEQRLAYMVERSRLSHVITTRALRPLFDRARVHVTEIGDDTSRPAPPPAAAAGDATAYVIYTSGSTGKPKGVAVPRRAVTNLLLSMLRRPGAAADDTLCAVTTLSFDIAVLELLVPLCAGAAVVIATEEEARDPRLLAALLDTHHVTILQATPVTWQMLCAAGWPGNQTLTALCGGEAMPPALARDLVPRVRALWNMYGPTETTVWSTCQRIDDPEASISVGTPIANTAIYVVDDHQRPVAAGVEGRLFIGGDGVALGYLHDDGLTAKRFVPDPFRGAGRMYDTGDRARRDASGALYVVGRTDLQVKLRGYRIELGEVEACLSTFGALEQVACTVRRDDPAAPELAAYYTLRAGSAEPTVADLRAHCGAVLPAHMVPSRFRCLDAIPRTPNGKVDRAALPRSAVERSAAPARSAPSRPRSDVERMLVEIWCSVLGIPSAGVHDNFFELGGTSLAAFSVAAQIGRRLGVEISVLQIFEHATIAALASHLQGDRAYTSSIREAYEHARARRRTAESPTAFDVAIVGAAGRFPGARDLDELWKNLRDGRETVTTFAREELDPLVPRQDRDDPHYIPARGVLEDIDRFDAAFFGISPNEAELMSPQIRVFMEVAWEAFENAGYVGETIRGPVGVWAGMGNNFYYLYNVLTRPDKLAVMGEITAEISNEKDHIAPRVSHKLNLKGPSLSVHAACATTLIVIENAYQALVSHQVDVALAGGVDIRTPQKSGQRYEEGGVFSIDGHCRPFDASATGTMFGEGAGALVLKRLDDAVRDGDTIHAVIKGAAVNHDGGHKVSYLAPSVEGQARVIASALGIGDVHPDTISYVEGHGTATPIGDPIEVEALTRVYRTFTQRRRYCAIGSIKGNFGHATTAAGVAGVLKVVLALRNRKIPPTLHFTAPNPRIDFATSPFFVADKLADWTSPGVARRASVSSFGFCGTNAHVILEEAPSSPASSPPSRPAELLLMSARSRAALDATAERLSSAIGDAGPADLADIAYTTHVGRKRHEHRRCAVVLGSEEAPAILAQAAGPRSASLESDEGEPPVAFVFPGQGAQYVNMGRRLYQGEPLFRQTIDRCAAALSPELGCDLRDLLFPHAADTERAGQALDSTRYTQPAIFVISYALAALYQHWGIGPSAFVGHSIGEFVAATLAGVMELEDALRLVATRGRLMQGLPSGSMLSVRLPMQTLVERLPAGLDLAADNGPQLCVVAGPSPLVAALNEKLSAEGVACRILHTSHAFHSSMMDPVLEPFLRAAEAVRLCPPQIPFVSTVTGDWIEASQATDPAYWTRHLRSPVQFSKAVRVLLQDGARVVLECGPRRTCAALTLQQRPANPGRVVAAMPDGAEPDDEYPSLLLALGSLWLNGCTVDWGAFHQGETRRRRALPTYPFQRRRFWIEPGNTVSFGVDGARPQPTAAISSEPDATDDYARAKDAGPARDPTTASVVTLLEELLGHRLDGIDADARFIALGLDSLLLTQLARGVRTRLGFEVTFRQLTERFSTTKLLADAIRGSRPAAAHAATNGASAARPDPAAPLSVRSAQARVELATTPAQLEMWLSSHASPEAGCAYNESFTVNLSGAVDDEAIVRAVRALPERHEALRGHYGADGERFLIEPRVDMAVARHDLSKLSQAGRAEALRRLAEQDARTPYDVDKGPLLRAALVDLGAGERTVLLSAHQGACDGWSLDVLLADLGQLYSAFAGKAAMPAPPHHGFQDYAALRSSREYASKVASSRDFWRQTLEAPPPPLELPGDGRRSRVRSSRADHTLRVVPFSVISPIKAFARAQGVSFFSVLFSGYAALLYRLSGATDFTVGIPIAGHPDAGMEDCVGPLVSMVPVRFRIDPQQSFLDLCRATNASVLDAREHAVVGFGEIVADLAARRDPVRVPPLAVTFTHVQKYGPGKLTFEGCSVGYYLNPRAFEAFELDLNVVESEDALELKIHGNSDLYSREWLDTRLRELERLLDHGCSVPETLVSAHALMPRDDAARGRVAYIASTNDDWRPPATPATVRRPYLSIVRDASRTLATAYKLRDCSVVGPGSRVVGRVWIHGEGRIVIGARVLLDGTRAPIELHPEQGAEIVIADDVVIEGGTSIEATHSVSIGPRTHVGMYCKIMDSHFHALDDRFERPPAKAVFVEQDVQLGSHVILMAGAHVGRGTTIEARTVVGRSIGRNAIARGIPAKIHGHGGTDAHRG